MTYRNLLKRIHAYPRTAGVPTLERMKLLCRYLGDPQKKLKFVHIAGTNGKGSVAAMLDSILRISGYSTGRYISPYVLDFRERMTFNGEMISYTELSLYAKEVFKAAEKMQADIESVRNGGESPYPIPKIILDGKTSQMPVQFEIVTAISFLYFLECGCDIVLLECGLGGKYDATNVIDPPLVSVIMSIGLDHTELLGETAIEIAEEKCGIIKQGTGEVISYPQEPDVMSVIAKHSVEINARLTFPFKNEFEVLQTTLGGLYFKYRGKEYKTKLAAAYQMENAAVAVEAATALGRLGMDIGYDRICEGLLKTRFPARFEVMGVTPTVIVDGAHNDSGISAFCRSVEAVLPNISEGNLFFVLGMLRDKDPSKALRPFVKLVESGKLNVKKIITITPDSPRAMEAEELKKLISQMLSGVAAVEIEAISTVGKSKIKDFSYAIREVGQNDTLITFGSLYLAAELRPIISDFLDNYYFNN
ncbi:MAG: folylpolyglutamate synthase/dihydrofolate synthase family protein [Clostridia bacterium]|nr:folylpolyglutamate synthase/dihydrofolate synthase family protein [Clostridia bacterium]